VSPLPIWTHKSRVFVRQAESVLLSISLAPGKDPHEPSVVATFNYLSRHSSPLSCQGKRGYFNKTIYGSKKDAQKWLTAALHDQDMGVFVESASMPFTEYLDSFLKRREQLNGISFPARLGDRNGRKNISG
jgi:hypothetical protein